jgi:uncharacterized membrane protein (UPF0182 family)
MRFSRLVFLALLGLVFLAVPRMVDFYTEWLWFGEVGYQAVFTTLLKAQGALFVGAFAASVAWFGLNIRVAVSSLGDRRPTFVTRAGLAVPFPEPAQIWRALMGVAMVVSLLFGLAAASNWDTWLAWRSQQPFRDADPILGLNAAFYVFSLPLWQGLVGAGQALVVLAGLAAGGLYFVTGGLTTGFPSRLSVRGPARRHLASLVAVFFLLMAVDAWLRRPEYLLEPTSIFFGATYADVSARMPAALLLMGVSLLGVVLAALHALTPRNWPIPVALGLFVIVAAGTELYAGLIQRFVVTPNEQARESPFIQHNIDATRRAYALDAVEERELSGDATLTREDIARNGATLENVRLWDHQPLLDTFGQIQEIRTYYDFVSVDNDRYPVNGRLRQVMLSGRELNSRSLPNLTWVNERLTFTHGYGLTLGPVNQVTSEGLPVLFVRDLPPVASAGFNVEQPSIYFGELANNYVVVRTRAREFHYPKGEDNVFTEYDGMGGVVMDSLFKKLVFAVRFGAYQLLLSDDITRDSRIMYNRQIGDRVRRLAPFLAFDQDPYLVLADGRLFWIYDAYTTSSRYPYSTRVRSGLNYIRNSVKFVIDAYDGTTTAYLAEPDDPIAATYARIFPTLFQPIDEMPASLRAHVRYPEDIFALQARLFATYHMTQPSVFYNREDLWETPSIDENGEAREMQPYYTIMRLPGEADAEFIQMLPFTPSRRDNLAAWLVARSDGENYGKLRVFQFPKQKLVFGPRQVVARMSQDQTIAPQITLWNQQGSQVIWGTLMVIPIEESLIYVRPLYLRSAGGRIPELTRVIVAYNNQIVMEPTLDAALGRLFGGAGQAPEATTTQTQTAVEAGQQVASGPSGPAPASSAPAAAQALDALAAEAQRHYARAIEAQRAGDWAVYGEEIKQLGATLDRMRGAQDPGQRR